MKLVPVALAAAVVLCLVSCVPEPDPEPSGTKPTATSSPNAPDPTSTPEPTVYPAVDVPCDQLISAQVIYDFNSNFSLVGSFDPAAGTLSAAVLERNGTVCRWVNDTSGETIDLAVANLPEAAFTELGNDAVESSQSVPIYGVEGYFEVAGSVGQAQAFSSPYWIVLESAVFLEPGEVTPLMDAVVSALG